jgi:ABC-2 type transport system ATP-binding protein
MEQTMISIKNLYKSYGKHQVLNGLSLNINDSQNDNKGIIYGFLGKNGAGKTTTMNILTGIAKFQSGECYVKNVKLMPNLRQYISGIGYLPESPGMYSYMTGREYLNFIGSLQVSSKKEVNKRADEMLELTGLKTASNRKIGGYSRGMRQRMGMAAIMFHKPNLIFLDEPTSALDPEGRMAILEILEHLRNDGCTVFLSTHILSDVEKICDRIGILHNGKLMLEGNMTNIMKEQVGSSYNIEFSQQPDIKIIEHLKSIKGINKVDLNGPIITTWVDSNFTTNDLFTVLSNTSLNVESLIKQKPSLEDIFINILKEKSND